MIRIIPQRLDGRRYYRLVDPRLIREGQYRNNASHYEGCAAYFLCEETRVLILIFIETRSRGGAIGEALAVRAPETRILIKVWTDGRGTLCLAVKNHCHANSKTSKLKRDVAKVEEKDGEEIEGERQFGCLLPLSVWSFDGRILRPRYR